MSGTRAHGPVQGPFGRQAVVAEVLAVVGGEQDQRVLPQAEGVDRGQDAPDLVIDVRDECIVVRHHPAPVVVGQPGAVSPGLRMGSGIRAGSYMSTNRWGGLIGAWGA